MAALNNGAVLLSISTSAVLANHLAIIGSKRQLLTPWDRVSESKVEGWFNATRVLNAVLVRSDTLTTATPNRGELRAGGVDQRADEVLLVDSIEVSAPILSLALDGRLHTHS
jgi:hypothetical protein